MRSEMGSAYQTTWWRDGSVWWKSTWDDNIKMNSKEMGHDGLYWTYSCCNKRSWNVWPCGWLQHAPPSTSVTVYRPIRYNITEDANVSAGTPFVFTESKENRSPLSVVCWNWNCWCPARSIVTIRACSGRGDKIKLYIYTQSNTTIYLLH